MIPPREKEGSFTADGLRRLEVHSFLCVFMIGAAGMLAAAAAVGLELARGRREAAGGGGKEIFLGRRLLVLR